MVSIIQLTLSLLIWYRVADMGEGEDWIIPCNAFDRFGDQAWGMFSNLVIPCDILLPLLILQSAIPFHSPE